MRLPLLLLGLLGLCESAVRLSQDVMDIYMHRNDAMVVSLDDYIRGDGEEAQVESESELIQIEQQFKPMQAVKHQEDCFKTYVYNGKQAIFSLCSDARTVVHRYSDDTKDEIELQVHGFACVQMVYHSFIDRLIVGCVSPDDSSESLQLVVVLLDPSAFAVVSSRKYFLPKPTVARTSSDFLILLPHKYFVVIKYLDRNKSFSLLYVDSDQTNLVGFYTIDSNIEGDYRAAENCALTGVKSFYTDFYLVLHCKTTRTELYMKCLLADANKKLICPPDKTSKDQGNHITPHQVYILRKESPLPKKPNEEVYFFKLNRLFMVDFAKVQRRDIFEFKNLYFFSNVDGRKLLDIRGITLFSKHLYLAVKDLESKIDGVVTASIYRGYYRLYQLPAATATSRPLLVVDDDTKSLLRCVIHFTGDTSTTHRGVLFFGMKVVVENPTAASQDREMSSLFRLPVSITIKNVGAKPSRHWFYLNMLLDSDDAIELSLEPSYSIYRGALPAVLPLSKQSVQGYDPLLVVEPSDGQQVSIEYLDEIKVDQTKVKIPSKFVANYFVDGGQFLMFDGSQVLILNHQFDHANKTSSYSLYRSFSLAAGETLIDMCKSHDGIYVLASDRRETVRLYFLKKDQEAPTSVDWPVRATDGLISEVFGRIDVQLVVFREPGNYELHTGEFDNFEAAPTARFSRVDYINERIVPQRISWASRGQPYYLISTKTAKNYVVFEMALSTFESPETPIRNYIIPIADPSFKTCGFSKHIIVIQGVEVFGIDREFGNTYKRRYFPVSDRKITKIVSTHCDRNNPLLTVLFRDVSDKQEVSRFAIFRVEESGDFSLRRVHSRRLLDVAVSDDAVIKTQTDYIGKSGILTIFDQGSIREFAFQLSAPRVVIKSLSTDSQLFSFRAMNGESFKSTWQNTTIKIIDQTFVSSLDFVDRADPDKGDGLYDLERLLAFDGYYRGVQLSADCAQAGVSSLTGRATKLEDLHLSMVVDEIIMERHTVFGWNHSHIVVFQNGKVNLVTEEPDVTSANFVSEDTPTGLTQHIVGVTHDDASAKSQLLFLWRDQKLNWKAKTLGLQAGVKRLVGVKFNETTFGYCGVKFEDNALICGMFTFAPARETLDHLGVPAIVWMVDPIELFDAFGSHNKIIAIIKRRHNQIGSVYDFTRDEAANKLVRNRRFDLVLFPGVLMEHEDSQMECVEADRSNRFQSEAVCVVYTNGVYSYANRLVLNYSSKDGQLEVVAPAVSLLTTIVNMQGYSLVETSHLFNYSAVLLEKTGRRGLDHRFLVLVYRHEPQRHHPFVHFTPKDLRLEHVTDIRDVEMGLYTSNLTDCFLFVASRNKDGSRFVQSFRIDTVKLLVQKGASDRWTGRESLSVSFFAGEGRSEVREVFLRDIFGDRNQKTSVFAAILATTLSVALVLVVFGTAVILINIKREKKQDLDLTSDGLTDGLIRKSEETLNITEGAK